MTVKEAFILSGSGAAMVLVVAWMRYGPWHLDRRVHALWASLGSRGEVADVPEACDPVDAQLDTNPRELVEMVAEDLAEVISDVLKADEAAVLEFLEADVAGDKKIQKLFARMEERSW